MRRLGVRRAGNQRQVVNRVDGFGPLGAVVHPHRPADEGRLGVAENPCRFENLLGRESRNLGNVLGRVGANGFFECFKSGRVLRDIFPIHQIVFDE